MSEKDPENEDLDGGWEDDTGDEAPSTTAADAIELARLARVGGEDQERQPPAARPDGRRLSSSTPWSPARWPEGEPGHERGSGHPKPDLRATMPPPVPTSEYVAAMMGQAPESEVRPSSRDPMRPHIPTLAERHRAILQTLHEEDPLRFDFDDSRPEGGDDAPPQSMDAPSIETSLEAIDLDPELLKDTPVPPRPPVDSRADELDELPFDEVLDAVARSTWSGADAALSLALEEDEPKAATISDIPLEPAQPPLRVPRIPGFGARSVSENDRATIPGYNPDDPLDKVHDRFVVGDYSGALVLAEAVLDEDPESAEATRYAESCRDMLRQMYLSRIGEGRQVPRVAMGPDQLRWLTLDHRSGFLLACVDGTSSIDEILDVSGMPSLEALRILFELVQQGVIDVVDAPVSSPRSGPGSG